MKKTFRVLLFIILIVSMVMPASADTVYTNCGHYGQTVTASEDGYVNILFSNGYRGFCINKGWEGADAEDRFTIDNMALAKNNDTGANISKYLKVMFVDHFNDIFTVNTATMTCALKNANQVQRLSWYFSNDYNRADDAAFAEKITSSAQNRTESIPDHGYTVKVNDTTLATFDFHVLRSQGIGYQNFWTYKVTLTAYPAPEITAPTSEQTMDVAKDSSVPLSVTATDAESYQWQVDKGDGFKNIDGATSATYTVPKVTEENSDDQYRCVVTNTAGSDISPVFSVNMIKAPEFTAPTTNQTVDVAENGSVQLSVTATNSPTYQWQVDKGDGFKNIDGATSVTYTVPKVTEVNSSDKYRCVASNLAGSDISPVFSVNMIKAPEFTAPTTNQTIDVAENSSVELSVTATDAESYQWQVDKGDGFKNIDGATSATYTVPKVTEVNSDDQYRCVVSNPSGSVNSFVFTLKVNRTDPPVITKGGENDKIDAKKGEKVTLSVQANDGETYQWQVDKGNGFKDIVDATTSDYTVNTDEGVAAKYRCIVRNKNGEAVSGTFTVSVEVPTSSPQTGNPSDIDLCIVAMLLSLCALGIICVKRLQESRR